MRQLIAILGDSLRESLDRRGLQVLFGIGLLIVLVLLSMSFETGDPEAVIRQQAAELNRFELTTYGGSHMRGIGNEVELRELRRGGNADGGGFAGGWVADLAVQSVHEVDILLVNWETHLEARQTGDWTHAPEESYARTRAEREGYFEERFEDFGWTEAEAEQVSAEPAIFRVALRSDYPDELVGAHELGVFFGLVTVPISETSLAEQVVLIQAGVADTFVGFIGMLVLLSICSGFVPNMLQKGTVELLLARPVGRSRLLLSKYFGTVCFVLVFTGVVFALSWLAMAVRSGYWSPGFVGGALSMTAVFAVLYAVATLIGVATRSATLATLVSLAVWGASGVAAMLHHLAPRIFDPGSAGRRAAAALYWVLPKLPDLGDLHYLFLARAHLSPDAYERTIAPRLPDVDWLWAGGTTALFAAVVLAVALWVFRRRDF